MNEPDWVEDGGVQLSLRECGTVCVCVCVSTLTLLPMWVQSLIG